MSPLGAMEPINSSVMKMKRYLMIYKKNPRSKVFALLADLYRKKGEIDKAFNLCRRGVQEHPQFVLGHIALALTLLDMNKLEMAAESLEKAIELAPENIFAYKTLGQIWLRLKNPEKTLRAYKMVLFLDPENKPAKNILKKLETMTSVQYDSTGFSFKTLREVAQYISPPDTKSKEPPTLHPVPKTYSKREKQQFFARSAMVEALIYRKEFPKARQFIMEMKNIYNHQQWKAHIQALEAKLPSTNESFQVEKGNMKGNMDRKITVTETYFSKSKKKQQKIQKLHKLLTRIEQSQVSKSYDQHQPF